MTADVGDLGAGSGSVADARPAPDANGGGVGAGDAARIATADGAVAPRADGTVAPATEAGPAADVGFRPAGDSAAPDALLPAPDALLVAPDGPPPPPSAPAPITVFFNEPDGVAVTTIQDELVRLIDLASAGSEIRISMYEWGQLLYVEALARAVARNVDVRIVMDGGEGIEAPVREALSAALGHANLTYCPRGACIGTGINHNKFLLFSALDDGSSQVVAQGSHNLKSSQDRRFNHLVVVRGDASLYAEYRDYWADLRAGDQDLNYYRSFTGDSGVKGYFFPRAEGDLIVSVLDNVHCDAGAELHVAMAFFKNDRLPIAQKLRGLRDAGCVVRMVFGNYSDEDPDQDSPGADIRDALRGMDYVIYDLPGVTVHSKYLLIHARYGEGDAVETLVFAGSHNYTGAALRRNDEAMMRLQDGPSYQAFLQDWTTMRGRLP